MGSTEEVDQADTRLAAAGITTVPEPGATCCYARQDKTWAYDSDCVPWEYYTVLEALSVTIVGRDRQSHLTPMTLPAQNPLKGSRDVRNVGWTPMATRLPVTVWAGGGP